jgi:hypothetical protein
VIECGKLDSGRASSATVQCGLHCATTGTSMLPGWTGLRWRLILAGLMMQ